MSTALKLYPTRVSKYRAQPTVVDDIRFDSKREAKRYGELKLMAQAQLITDLRLQWKFPLHGTNGVKVATYIADFAYKIAGVETIEDVKGVKTPMYRLKKKLCEQQYGVTINEV